MLCIQIHKHTVDCEKPQVSDVITLMYNSTLEGSVLMYSCEAARDQCAKEMEAGLPAYYVVGSMS